MARRSGPARTVARKSLASGLSRDSLRHAGGGKVRVERQGENAGRGEGCRRRLEEQCDRVVAGAGEIGGMRLRGSGDRDDDGGIPRRPGAAAATSASAKAAKLRMAAPASR